MSEHAKDDSVRISKRDIDAENTSGQEGTVSPRPNQIVRESGTDYGMASLKTAITQEPIQYLVKDSGERVGVVLSLKDYQELCAAQSSDPELLVGLSDVELEILADGMLAIRLQERLSYLLHLSREGKPSVEEQLELDRLLEQIDQMNVLKARAMYTLQQRQEMTTT
jgi:hypothetical protein